jgi:hypothetical protein
MILGESYLFNFPDYPTLLFDLDFTFGYNAVVLSKLMVCEYILLLLLYGLIGLGCNYFSGYYFLY